MLVLHACYFDFRVATVRLSGGTTVLVILPLMMPPVKQRLPPVENSLSELTEFCFGEIVPSVRTRNRSGRILL